jgi:transcriptional regulator with GAF, ATPase, and Fis domain
MNIADSGARLRLIYELGNAFAARTHLDELLPFVVTKCREALESQGVSVLLLDPERNELYFAYSSQHDPVAAARLAAVRFPADRGVAGAVLRSGVSEKIDDVHSDLRFYPEVDRRLNNVTKSLLAAPLISFETPLGVIEAINRLDGVPFTLDEQWLLGALARSIAVAIDNATRFGQNQMSAQQLRMRLTDLARRDLFSEIVATSKSSGATQPFPPMLQLLRLAESAATSSITVLIEGETGVGKELIARAIHRASARADQTFLAVNCAALSESLIESQLFGHRRGAFTGATENQPGFFRAADRGVLFLDEIGDLPLAIQAKLLRVLQEGDVIAVGDTRVQKVDVRIIAATNRNIKEAVAAGRFREDLYYRLAVFPLRVPSLRERREDIPVLAARFAEVSAQRNRKRIRGLTTAAIELLSQAEWPGNVRQLQNEIERAVVLARNDVITPDNLSPELQNVNTQLTEYVAAGGITAESTSHGCPIATVPAQPGPVPCSLREAQQAFDKRFVCETLARHHGNISRAAAELSISRVALQKKMRHYGLR